MRYKIPNLKNLHIKLIISATGGHGNYLDSAGYGGAVIQLYPVEADRKPEFVVQVYKSGTVKLLNIVPSKFSSPQRECMLPLHDYIHSPKKKSYWHKLIFLISRSDLDPAYRAGNWRLGKLYMEVQFGLREMVEVIEECVKDEANLVDKGTAGKVTYRLYNAEDQIGLYMVSKSTSGKQDYYNNVVRNSNWESMMHVNEGDSPFKLFAEVAEKKNISTGKYPSTARTCRRLVDLIMYSGKNQIVLRRL